MNDHLSNFKVIDRQTFIEFIHLLRQDFVDNPESWENKNINDFLQAFSSYTEDI